MNKKLSFLLPIIISACATISAPTPQAPTQQVPIAPKIATHTAPSATPFSGTIQTASGSPFPRLGLIWPNPYKQPLDQIARYNWVILDDWMKDFLDRLRALNPNLLLLTSTNASEVPFRPDEPAYNRYLQSIPYEWYLTQVGTTLSTDIDASQTKFPVHDLLIDGESGKIKLFVPGDSALIENESVYIKAVDAASSTLVVQRGYVRPASSHKAGIRIAAHISFWPNSWVLNLSMLSPKKIADPAIGPERWAEYNARIGARDLADPRWAGIFVDRSDPNQSWLIGNSTARTIDPDQSNRLLKDYSAFDSSWNDGLRLYLDQLRSAIGNNRIILLNLGIPYYATVNGTNFEGVPDDSWFDPWHKQIIGSNQGGSYFDWVNKARQPNLTMIETYQDNSRPSPNDTARYVNPCNETSFTPNYRKMRFGLTSALLTDGYFSYEMNTQGHSSLCLMWFDEYDNAGVGRGYLGYPLGPAKRLADTVIPNLLSTNRFDSNEELSAWRTWADDGYQFSVHPDPQNPAEGSGAMRIDITQAQGENWRASFSYKPVPVVKGTPYTLSFYARADQARTINGWIQRDSDPWDIWLEFGLFNLTREWQKFEITVDSLGDDPNARLTFGVGAAKGSVWLDEPRLYKGNADIWERDFENGLVLVNATAEAVTIPLNDTYKKIDGRQDRSVNDGSLVKQIFLMPNDGVILLRNK